MSINAHAHLPTVIPFQQEPVEDPVAVHSCSGRLRIACATFLAQVTDLPIAALGSGELL